MESLEVQLNYEEKRLKETWKIGVRRWMEAMRADRKIGGDKRESDG